MKKHFLFTNVSAIPFQRSSVSAFSAAAMCCALILFMLIHAFTSTAQAISIDAHYTTASLTAQEHIAGNLLNSDRSIYGLPPLKLDPELCRIARSIFSISS